MKQIFILTIGLLFVAVNNVTSQMSPEDNEKFIAGIQLCQKESGASDADISDLYNRIMPTTRPAKCFNDCIMSKLEMIKDGKLVAENLIKIIEMDKTDLIGKDGKMLKASMKDIIAECNDVTDADKCEYAAKIRTCLNAAAKKREFCPNVF